MLEKALAVSPGTEELAMALARVYVSQKEYELAASILDRFLNQEKTANYETYFTAGQALLEAGKYEQAINALDKAVKHYGTDINLLNLIGECYLKAGRKEEAMAVWQKSLELNPEQPELKKKLEAAKKK